MTMNQQAIHALREHYDNNDASEHFEDATLDTRVAAEVLVSTSIRLPQSLVNRVRAQAATVGMSATALMRQWITERAQQPSANAVISVADLEALIAERAHGTGS